MELSDHSTTEIASSQLVRRLNLVLPFNWTRVRIATFLSFLIQSGKHMFTRKKILWVLEAIFVPKKIRSINHVSHVVCSDILDDNRSRRSSEGTIRGSSSHGLWKIKIGAIKSSIIAILFPRQPKIPRRANT